ncbi:lipid phosphate phosphatase epsilon 2, chloroplastic [Dendrobium catenatum]|nr:lipid phosphate phosphatase epsilon 2, chloroplastic [Dendrobium catenatum]
MSSYLYMKKLSLRLAASTPYICPRIKAAPASKGPIFICGISCRNCFLGKLRLSNHRKKKKKVELAIFDSFHSGGVVGEDEDDLTFANRRMERLEAALNGMSKWLVAGLFAVAIIWKHDAVTIWAAMGTIVNSLLSAALKKMLNQERPSALRSDPGMPSSHAQSIFYGVVFAIHSVMEWMGVNASSVLVGASIFICGAYLSWLRVSQQLHTLDQVFVGATLGSACSISWLWIWHLFVLQAFNSSITVRAILLLGAATYYVTLLLYAIRHWLLIN